jgi:hypothetical protein
MSDMSQITDHILPPAGRAVVVSYGVNKGKGSAVRTSLGYAAEHGFDALVLLADMLKTYGRIWTRCYRG